MPVRKAVTDYEPSQLEFYRSLPTNCSVSTLVAAKTPTLAEIKKKVSLNDVRALLSIAVCEVCDFFNVGKNMNDIQVALTVDLIIERFWYFKLEEIKHCLRKAMMREKLFDRLDGNIIMGWLESYDAERTEEAMRQSEQEAQRRQNETAEAADAISFDEFLSKLEQRARTDKEAAKLLAHIKDMQAQRDKALSAKEREAEKHDFRLQYYKYLFGKKQ